MWATVMSVIVLAMTILHGANEPSETAMRHAFTTKLSDEVGSVLDFVRETRDPSALARIQNAGTELFRIHSFTKLDCAPAAARGAHDCGFAVEIATVKGMLRQTLRGRFETGARGLVLINHA